MLTKKQLILLSFIHERIQSKGVPPSFDEMKQALDLRSKSGIHRLITALEERGYIRRLAHKARAMEVIKLPETLEREMKPFQPKIIQGGQGDAEMMPEFPYGGGIDAQSLPVVGKIAAGVPIEAINQVARSVAVPGQMLSANSQHYALEVKGDSMIDAGILDGDTVVIRKTQFADNGDIVVALIEDHEATLKRYYKKGRSITLEAANPMYPPRILAEGEVKVQGRLVGLIRSY